MRYTNGLSTTTTCIDTMKRFSGQPGTLVGEMNLYQAYNIYMMTDESQSVTYAIININVNPAHVMVCNNHHSLTLWQLKYMQMFLECHRIGANSILSHRASYTSNWTH